MARLVSRQLRRLPNVWNCRPGGPGQDAVGPTWGHDRWSRTSGSPDCRPLLLPLRLSPRVPWEPAVGMTPRLRGCVRSCLQTVNVFDRALSSVHGQDRSGVIATSRSVRRPGGRWIAGRCGAGERAARWLSWRRVCRGSGRCLHRSVPRLRVQVLEHHASQKVHERRLTERPHPAADSGNAGQ